MKGSILTLKPVADLHSKILDARPPWGPKFFQFHAVFGKIWQNRMLAPPLGSWRPLLGEILDPPLKAQGRLLQKSKTGVPVPHKRNKVVQIYF